MTQAISQPLSPTPALIDQQSPHHTHRDATIGLIYGIAAYSFWGIVAAYFKQLAQVPPLVVLSNRIAWSTVVLVIIVACQRRWREVLAGLHNRRTMLLLAAST